MHLKVVKAICINFWDTIEYKLKPNQVILKIYSTQLVNKNWKSQKEGENMLQRAGGKIDHTKYELWDLKSWHTQKLLKKYHHHHHHHIGKCQDTIQ